MLKFLLTSGIAVGSFLLARRHGASLAILCPLAPIAIFMSWIGMTTIRAQVYTLLFIVCLFYFFDADRRGKRWWILPWLSVYLLWLNLHGGFVVGIVLYSLHFLEQLTRRQPVRHLVLSPATWWRLRPARSTDAFSCGRPPSST